MTSHTGRLYTAALGLVVFFLAWAVIAAHPWGAPVADRKLARLAARETQLRQEAKLVQALVAERWANYRAQLKLRRAQISHAKTTSSSVRVVNLPPLTITRTS